MSEPEYIPVYDDGTPVEAADYAAEVAAESERPTIETRIVSDAEAELRCVGSMLLDAAKVPAVISRLPDGRAEFTDPRCAVIYGTIERLFSSGEPVADRTIRRAVIASGEFDKIGGDDGLTLCVQRFVSAVGTALAAERYADMVHSAHVKRRLSRAAHLIGGIAADPGTDAGECVGKAQSLIDDLSKSAVRDEPIEAASLVDGAVDRIRARMDADNPFSAICGLDTGLHSLTGQTGGFRPGELILLAARPGDGKTSLLLNIAVHVASEGGRALIFSCEMTRQALIDRAVCSQAEHDSTWWGERARNNAENVRIAADRIKRMPLVFVDTPRIRIDALRAVATTANHKKRLAAVFVDYLQLVRPDAKYERDDIALGSISAGLKALASELSIPVVAAVQLNRAGEGNPKLSNLHGSGNFEQDADIVVCLYAGNRDDMRIADVQKNRNGAIGICELGWEPKFTRFTNRGPMPIVHVNQPESTTPQGEMPWHPRSART